MKYLYYFCCFYIYLYHKFTTHTHTHSLYLYNIILERKGRGKFIDWPAFPQGISNTFKVLYESDMTTQTIIDSTIYTFYTGIINLQFSLK